MMLICLHDANIMVIMSGQLLEQPTRIHYVVVTNQLEKFPNLCHHWYILGTLFAKFIMLGHFHYVGAQNHYVGQHDEKQLENNYKIIMLDNIITMTGQHNDQPLCWPT